MGMVGGGQGAFIGAIHRMAAFLDNNIELVCGAFSSDSARSKLSGKMLHIPLERCYDNYQTMFEEEAKLPENKRMQFVVIVTPNYLHFNIAQAAIFHGFHVLSDKPATFDLKEALALKALVEQSDCLYGLTHTYTGYPMIKEAKHLIKSGELGHIVKVIVEYSQGWLSDETQDDNKQASWRLDPTLSGASCSMGDIGVHAANLVEYVSGLTIEKVCADLNRTVKGRQLDDDGTVLLEFDNGAKGVLLASQIAVGEENRLSLRIYGEKQSIEWHQMEPNSLLVKSQNQPTQILRSGGPGVSHNSLSATRTPAGHPEGYIEAFANIYQEFAQMIRDHQAGTYSKDKSYDVPDIDDACRGMAFIENVVHASSLTCKWHDVSRVPLMIEKSEQDQEQ